jgi:two-component sensor histidine kinase
MAPVKGPVHIVSDTFGRMSSGQKMLAILTLALLPLGLIALLASLDSARANRQNRHIESRIVASASARQLNAAVNRGAISLRAVTTALSVNAAGAQPCRRTIDSLALTQPFATRFAVFTRVGEPLCATKGFSVPPPLPPPVDNNVQVTLIGGPSPALHFAVVSADGNELAIGEFPYAALVQITRPPGRADFGLVLRQGDVSMNLATASAAGPLAQTTHITVPVLGGNSALVMTLRTVPIEPVEALMALLPLLMWLAAAIISWFVMNRLLLRPLSSMQRAVAAYGAGDNRLAIPAIATPATEIRGLADAFQHVAQTVAMHEAELEQAIARQVKLTREVHHRVKNNLQVIASLLNLHARGATTAEAAAAYASIQRRVDALAIVHRHHYAAQDESYGIQLRSLIGEIATNLRASAGPGSLVGVALDVAPIRVAQDVAVAVAFLTTEIVDLAIVSGEVAHITISLVPAEENRARLSIRSTLDPARIPEALYLRYARVLEGLARQLRSPLRRDDEAGLYEIEFAGLGIDDSAAAPPRGQENITPSRA